MTWHLNNLLDGREAIARQLRKTTGCGEPQCAAAAKRLRVRLADTDDAIAAERHTLTQKKRKTADDR